MCNLWRMNCAFLVGEVNLCQILLTNLFFPFLSLSFFPSSVSFSLSSLGYCFQPHGHVEVEDAHLKLKSIK